jgi:hypothetical protein
LTGKLGEFSGEIATAWALGNRALDVLDNQFGKTSFIAGIKPIA